MSHKKESPAPQPSKPAFDPKKSREPKPHPQHPDPNLEEPAEDPEEDGNGDLPEKEEPYQPGPQHGHGQD
jgi:hypothetical protein